MAREIFIQPNYKMIVFMKSTFVYCLVFVIIVSCNSSGDKPTGTNLNIEGTWQLVTGTLIENGDTTVTDYTKDQAMIKIINETHFSFLNHDLKKEKDSTAIFSAGGGRYLLEGDQYTEYLEYCNHREWEGHTFQFTINIDGDTLTQRGVEKIENLNVERYNIEKYTRVKS
jgi:hypothetical protein